MGLGNRNVLWKKFHCERNNLHIKVFLLMAVVPPNGKDFADSANNSNMISCNCLWKLQTNVSSIKTTAPFVHSASELQSPVVCSILNERLGGLISCKSQHTCLHLDILYNIYVMSFFMVILVKVSLLIQFNADLSSPSQHKQKQTRTSTT